jgi:formylglycine-generating enzyme required for sulfatase activity
MAQIFLCHASEDKAQVREVYHRLRAIEGFEPWLDEEDLLPGQEWAREIPRALQASDFILIFLSRNSVAKRGYVQREMKLALDAWQELPEGTIHTIPVRLDDCEVPEPFRRYHYTNLFDARGFERLTRAIHTGLTQRQHFTPDSVLEPPPDPIRDSEPPAAGVGQRSVVDASVPPSREPESPTVSQSQKPLVPAQKSPRVSVVTVVGLVIAVVSALAAVIVVPEGRVWLGLDKPSAQREARKAVSPPREITTNIGMEFVFIPAGTFLMGSPDSDMQAENNEKPAHRVTISQPFYLGKYEVTQAQWEKVMGTNPSLFTGNPNRPVDRVSWADIQEFITRLNTQEGWEVCRLPTEAEWEYAARAGTETPRYHPDINAIAWYEGNSNDQTHPVGQKLPNAWGLYDMLGNVLEWCQDGLRTYTVNTAIDPMGPMSAGADRARRGGSWYYSARFVQAAFRYWRDPGLRLGHLGFRCASSGPSK